MKQSPLSITEMNRGNL